MGILSETLYILLVFELTEKIRKVVFDGSLNMSYQLNTGSTSSNLASAAAFSKGTEYGGLDCFVARNFRLAVTVG